MNREVLHSAFGKSLMPESFDEIKISLASPEKIISWSYGEIKKPETINYRTFKPERDGLFCARILGPVKDYECLCGKYKRMKYRGVTCEKCGVEVTLAKTRRERMGHIELAAPVAHIWFLKSLPSRIGLMLDMKLKDLERVLYFESFVVTDPGLTEFSPKQLLTEAQVREAEDEYGADNFRAGIGAEAIRELLQDINLQETAEDLRADLSDTKSETKRTQLSKRLKLIDSFMHSGNRPEWMILTVIPVIPPDLRPLVPLDGGRFATSDLNDLYRRVINRNNRLKRLMELNAPDIIMRNEKRMLQESVDALFDNGRRGRTINGVNKRPLKSLSDMLKGKQGRFRQNLLGKRVDFSGRSVIVSGPDLKLHQCGIPKKMALELFKPFIYSRLEKLEISTTVKHSKKIVEKEEKEVWDILEAVIREHPVLLNRAPTLHRLGIQAFEPVLIEGKAIQLHPLVCSAFNADFDGDQMAVHVPLSLEAQLEARVLMMSTNNVLSPANGAPIIVPSQDMVLGLYHLSLERSGMVGETRGRSGQNGTGGLSAFGSIEEVQHALLAGRVHLHAKVRGRIKQIDENGLEVYRVFDTTPGRMMIGSLLPLNARTPFTLVNRLLRKKEVQEVIDAVYRYCGQKESVIFCDRIMALGFQEACSAGISFGKDDMMIPAIKDKYVEEARKEVKRFEDDHWHGALTQLERYNKVVDAWTECSDNVAEAMMAEISSVRHDEAGRELEPNSVFMMSDSGARGSPAQMKQLAGMRGLMAKPSGEIIETPIIANFKEGLNVLEYFNSTHGARKGLTDTALKTSNSGYLTRRLVDVAQDCIVREQDCGTKEAITVRASMRDGVIVAPLSERLLGRVAAEDLTDPVNGEDLVKTGDLIEESAAEAIENAGIQSVKIRSPLTCISKEGVCCKCYGRDLARGTPVNIGEAVGIIAAQSIGEPGTQLTMRTFHIGGIAQAQQQQSSVNSSHDGVIQLENIRIIENQAKDRVVISRNAELNVEDSSGRSTRYRLPIGAQLSVATGQEVKSGDVLFVWDPNSTPIFAEADGVVTHQDLIDDVTVRVDVDALTGKEQRIVLDSMLARKPSLQIIREEGADENANGGQDNYPYVYQLSVGTILSVEDHQKVKEGDILARVPREVTKTRDITGGLPRVAELFEARKPADHAILAEVEGRIIFEKEYKAKTKIAIVMDGPEQLIPVEQEKLLLVDGASVEADTAIVDRFIAEIDGTVELKRAYKGRRKVLIWPAPVEDAADGEAAFFVKNGNFVQAGDVIAEGCQAECSGTVTFEQDSEGDWEITIQPEAAAVEIPSWRTFRVKSGDAVIAGDELAEPILTGAAGTVRIEQDGEKNRKVSVRIKGAEHLVPKRRHILVQHGDFVRKGDPIVDGNPAPQDLLRALGVEKLAEFLIQEVQDVYRLQGVKINDKHIEVIVRQMLQKVEITAPGDTNMLRGDQVDKLEFEEANARVLNDGGEPAQAEPLLLGITKASLQTRSFISAASFQETTRVLTDAAVKGKSDRLVGLKENVIVGRLIPAGTGGAASDIRRIAQDRDRKVLELRKTEAELVQSEFPLIGKIDFDALPQATEDG